MIKGATPALLLPALALSSEPASLILDRGTQD